MALLARLQAEQKRRAAENKLASYKPYAKQKVFHNASTGYRERLFMAGNQLGKTLAGAAETAIHLTGLYPDWWEGRRYDRPVRGWAGSKTNEVTRDGVQRYLVGEPKNEAAWGTGWVPKARLKDWTRRQGVPSALDGILVEHVSGGLSMLGFKSYDQGREKWQGETLDFVWLDEEPDHEIYMEALTRTNATGGFSFLTFTPLLGMSNVVESFVKECGLSEESAGSAGKHVTRMTIYDAAHYSEAERDAIIAAYPAHERDARTKGLPALGSGRIFPVTEEEIVCDAFPIPAHWPQINGVDFGWDHPFGGVSCAWDRESDIWYVTRTYRQKHATPVLHAAAMKPWGDWIPTAWPHDGLQHDKGSGEDLAAQYRAQGLNLLEERATHEDGGNGVEAGLLDMLGRMQTGRWKVFRHLSDWLEEFRLYHRKEGKIVKERDDVLSASRYAYMMRRFAETEPNRSGWGAARRRVVV